MDRGFSSPSSLSFFLSPPRSSTNHPLSPIASFPVFPHGLASPLAPKQVAPSRLDLSSLPDGLCIAFLSPFFLRDQRRSPAPFLARYRSITITITIVIARGKSRDASHTWLCVLPRRSSLNRRETRHDTTRRIVGNPEGKRTSRGEENSSGDSCARATPSAISLQPGSTSCTPLSFYFEIPSIHHASETWLAPPSPPPRSALPRRPTFPSPSFTLPSCHLSLSLSPELSRESRFFLRYT